MLRQDGSGTEEEAQQGRDTAGGEHGRTGGKKCDHPRTRTWNLQIRSLTRYPLRQEIMLAFSRSLPLLTHPHSFFHSSRHIFPCAHSRNNWNAVET